MTMTETFIGDFWSCSMKCPEYNGYDWKISVGNTAVEKIIGGD